MRLVGRRPRSWPAVIAWALLFAAVWAAVLLNSWGHLTPDIKPEIYLAPARMARDYLFSWQRDPQLGFPSFNVGLAPVAALVAWLEWLGAEPWLAARILRGLLLCLGAVGMARFVRAAAEGSTVEHRAAVAGWVGALVFVLNPYTVVAGSTLAILLPMALLPWQLICLLRGLEVGGWRWPALFGLTFAAMSGMNAGVVPLFQLLAVPGVVVLARVRRRTSWRRVTVVLARCALAVVLVSLYWLVPALRAVDTGATVVDNSESLNGISAPSSFAEVQRGLGLWPMYGSDGQGPWQPGFASYLASAFVVAGTFLLPAAAAGGSGWIRDRAGRLAGVTLLATAAVVMVGTHAPASPFGRVLESAFEHVPTLGGFRTTNKVGAVLVVGLSLVLALSVVSVWRGRWLLPAKMAAGALGGLVLLTSVWPAITGSLYPVEYDVPAYWWDAAGALDEGSAHSRVWFVPGEALADYRWTQDAPDDLAKALFTRPTLVRTTLPTFSPEASNLLAAADSALTDDEVPADTLGTFARYLGATDLLVRSDVAWEQHGGPRPSAVLNRVSASNGVTRTGEYGSAGENTWTPAAPSKEDQALHPLSTFEVDGDATVVRAAGRRGTLLIDGDGYAVPDLAGRGVLDGARSFRYLGHLTSEELGSWSGSASRIVLTDTNRRRTTVPNRLVDSAGPLLAANEPTGPARTLFDPARQTVLEVSGGTAASSDEGSAFGVVAATVAENAFDGDASTSWQAGDFGRGVGQWVKRTFATPVTLGRVVVVAADLGPVRVSRLRVDAGGTSSVADVSGQGTATFDLHGIRAQEVKVTVMGVRGSGFNRIGIAEVDVGPVEPMVRTARLPSTLQNLLAVSDPSVRAGVEALPLDLSLSRARGATGDADDEERSLERAFTLPTGRTFLVSGRLRPSAAAGERDFDTWAGYGTELAATSSSRAFDSPTVRASFALDGNPDTAWVPGRAVDGESISIAGPPQRISRIDLLQEGAGRKSPENWATRVRVQVGPARPFEAAVGPGLTTLQVPTLVDATTGEPISLASQVRITILSTARPVQAALVGLSEISVGDWRMRPDPAAIGTGCLDALHVDGKPLRVRPQAPLTDRQPVPFEPCDGALTLGPGDHRTTGVSPISVDHLALVDQRAPATPATSQAPGVTLVSSSPTRKVVRVGPAGQPYDLVLGEAFHGGWVATADGAPLGQPTLVDGYSTSWHVEDLGPHTIVLDFAPQRVAWLAAGASAMAILGMLAVALVPRAPRRHASPAPAAGPAPSGVWLTFRTTRTAPPSRRPLGGDRRTVLAAPAAAWFFGGPWVGALTVPLAAWVLASRPSARRVATVSALLYALVPAAWLYGNRDRLGVITPDLVTLVPWPHRLAGLALVALVLSLWAGDSDVGPRPDQPRREADDERT